MSNPNWFPVQGKTCLVYGLGRSGLAAIRWLHTHGASVIAFDDKDNHLSRAQSLGARIVSPNNLQWGEIAAVVQSPGVPLYGSAVSMLTLAARQNNVPIIGEGDLFALAHPHARIVGITGTNGKSTTTALIGHILKSCGRPCETGGNIGIPLLDLPEAPLYVLELSSNQLELYTHLKVNVAGWLNITPDHLDYHGTMENYLAAKKRILNHADPDFCAVMGIDDTLSHDLWQQENSRYSIIPVSVNPLLHGGISVSGGWLTENGDPVLNLETLSVLRGRHNIQNLAVAYGICRVLDVKRDDIVKGIQTFPGLAHRQEKIATLNGIEFINDSKGTNAIATAQALVMFDHVYWIAGGKAKRDGIAPLAPFFAKIKHAFLIGEAQEQFAQTLHGKVPYTCSGDLEKAVEQAVAMAQHDQISNANSFSPIILLSPACASYDQFRDFEHRGEVFRSLVQSLVQSLVKAIKKRHDQELSKHK